MLKPIMIRAYDEEWKIRFVASTYVYDNSPAIIIENFNNEYQCWEDFGNLTVNLSYPLPEGCAFIDTNNCNQSIIDKLLESKLIEYTGETQRSGYCEYPLADITVLLREIVNTPYQD